MEGFQDLQFYDYMRLATALLALIAAYRLSKLVRKDYKTYSRKLAEWIWFIFAVLFTQFIAALENVGANTTYRYGALLSFFIAASAVRAARDDGPLQKF
jgi:hypothetical protein